MNAPDAEALSILLPAGNGNATQINILEGNVIDPQFNPAGNTSNNTTVGNIMLGGTPVDRPTSPCRLAPTAQRATGTSPR